MANLVYLYAVKPSKLIRAIWQVLRVPRILLLLPLLACILPASVQGQVVLNEIMANNMTTLSNKAGLFGDWVELYNAGSASFDISGYSLTDTPTNIIKFRFPVGTPLVGPHAYVIVWCDSGTGAGEYHAPF